MPYFENIEVSHTSLIQRSKWFIKTICKGSVVRQLWVSMKTTSQSHYSCENKKYTVAIADMLPQMCLSKQLVGLHASSKRLTCIVLQSAGFMLGAVFDPLNKIRSKIHLSFDLELIDSITCLKQIVPSLFSMLVTHLFFNARWAGLEVLHWRQVLQPLRYQRPHVMPHLPHLSCVMQSMLTRKLTSSICSSMIAV